MTSPSMKSAEKKSPEKKRNASESSENQSSDVISDHVEAAPRARLHLNIFAWFRVFRFAGLLVKQG